MKAHRILALFAIFGLVLAVGCSNSNTTEAPDISVAELATLIDKASTVAIFDANGDETRKEFGVIPGATLLSDYSSFDMKILPEAKEKKLVFYCSSERCAAAPKAAVRAMEAGYKDVNVLKAGIKGWSAAGQKTDKSKG